MKERQRWRLSDRRPAPCRQFRQHSSRYTLCACVVQQKSAIVSEVVCFIASSVCSMLNVHCVHGLDWIVQCFTSPPTQYRLYGRRFLQVKRPNQQHQSTEGRALCAWPSMTFNSRPVLGLTGYYCTRQDRDQCLSISTPRSPLTRPYSEDCFKGVFKLEDGSNTILTLTVAFVQYITTRINVDWIFFIKHLCASHALQTSNQIGHSWNCNRSALSEVSTTPSLAWSWTSPAKRIGKSVKFYCFS